MNWLRKLWNAIKPDPYFYIAMAMELEGYTDNEIAIEIARMKEADAKRLTSR